jgi:hypothetical protein
VETIREVLVALARRYAFRELAYLVGAGATADYLTTRDAALLQQICAYGQRLLDLDAEDFANPDAASGATTDTTVAELVGDELVPQHLVERGRQCRMRQTPHERPRAALTSLRPAYRLLLEVIAIRWRRHETAALVAALHIASEYAPLLAWEPVLGHAADPAEIRKDPAFNGPQSRWGHHDDRACPHTRPQKSAASRALRVVDEPPAGWRAYLDRQHSLVANALRVCATRCSAPCAVMLARTEDERDRVGEACRVAAAYGESAVVRLRHAAPVGHGFGVPSPAEVSDAWQISRAAIGRRGGIAIVAMTDDGFPLPGLPSLFGAIASAPLTPDTLLADTVTEILKVLRPKEDTPWPSRSMARSPR